jgi:O-antigen/teichoic acid export membrane protein
LPGEFILHLPLLTLINALLSTNLNALLGKQRITSYNYILILQAGLNLVIIYILFNGTAFPQVRHYLTSLYIAMTVAFIGSFILLIPMLGKISGNLKGLFSSMLSFGITNQAGHILKFASFRLSYFLLNQLNNKSGLGIFSNGVSLTESVLLITNSITTVQYTAISNTNDKKQSQQLTVRLSRMSTLICLLAMLPLILLPSSFYVWLFGDEFGEVRTIILLLAPGTVLYNIALVAGHYFSGIGKYRINTLSNLIGLGATLILSGAFFANYTIVHAAIISSSAYLFTTLYILYSFRKESGIGWTHFIPSLADLKTLQKWDYFKK